MLWEYKKIISKFLNNLKLRENYILSFQNKRQLDLIKIVKFLLNILKILLLDFIERIINLYYIILKRKTRVIRYSLTTILIFTQIKQRDLLDKEDYEGLTLFLNNINLLNEIKNNVIYWIRKITKG